MKGGENMRIAICNDDYDEYYGSNTASRTYEGLSNVFVRPYFLAKYNPCILLPIIEGS